MMNKIGTLLFITGLLIGWNCVGPPDPDHWLVNNYPGVVNTESLFKFEVKGDNFSFEEDYTLKMIFSPDNKLLTNLRVSDYGGSTKDTSSILLINWDGEEFVDENENGTWDDGEHKIIDYNENEDSTEIVFEFIDVDSNGIWTENIDTLLFDYNEDNDSTDVLYEFDDSNGNNIWDPPEMFTDTYANSQWDPASVYPNYPILISKNLSRDTVRTINPVEYYPESISIKLDKFTGVIEFILIKSTVE